MLQQNNRESFLLLQENFMDSKCLGVQNLEEALERMILVYCEACKISKAKTLEAENSQHAQMKGMFSVEQMLGYFEGLENVMYAQRKGCEETQGQSRTPKSRMEYFPKDYVLQRLRKYASIKAEQSSLSIAQSLFQSGIPAKQFLARMSLEEGEGQ